MYYSNGKTGAVVLRVAKSWLRIGSLEVLSQSNEMELLRWVFQVLSLQPLRSF